MSNRKRLLLLSAVLVGVLGPGWMLAARQTWGPELLTDPGYLSGRASLCEPPELRGDSHHTVKEDLGEQVASRGVARSQTYAFDASTLSGGAVAICSEYGFVRLRGVEGTRGRLSVVLTNPFPGGARAVDDTNFRVDVRSDDGQLRIAVWQTTQGTTGFRSFFSRGTRSAALNVDVELPRTGTYDLRLVANHQRLTVTNLDVQGTVDGYGSPGADIDVRLAGRLRVRLGGRGYVNRFPEDLEFFDDRRTGIIARLVPLVSTVFEAECNDAGDAAEVRVSVLDSEAGLDVTARSADGSPLMEIGPAETSRSESRGAHTRSAGFASAPVQLRIDAVSAGGQVAVRREAGPS